VSVTASAGPIRSECLVPQEPKEKGTSVPFLLHLFLFDVRLIYLGDESVKLPQQMRTQLTGGSLYEGQLI
jgi:hypothetical protein